MDGNLSKHYQGCWDCGEWGMNFGSPTEMRLPQLHAPMSTTSTAQYVFLVGTCTHKTTHTAHTRVYMCIYTYTHTNRANRNGHTQHPNKHKQHQWPHPFPFLADQGEQLLVGNMYVHVYIRAMWNLPATGLRPSVWTYKTLRSWLVQNHTHARSSSWPWTLSQSCTSSWIFPGCLTPTHIHVHRIKHVSQLRPQTPVSLQQLDWDPWSLQQSAYPQRHAYIPVSPATSPSCWLDQLDLCWCLHICSDTYTRSSP